MTLFKKLESLLSTNLLATISEMYDGPSGDLEKALSGIFYTMVAGLIRRSNSAMSTGMMVSQIKKNLNEDIRSFDFYGKFENDSNIDKIIKSGLKANSQILPAFKSPLLSLISTYALTGKQVTTGFIGFCTSFFIKELGEMLEQDSFDTEDLIIFLQGHRESLFEQAPKSLLEKMIPALGLQEISTMKLVSPKKSESKNAKVEEAEEVGSQEQDYEEDSYAESSESSTSKYIYLFLAFMAALVIGYFVYSNSDKIFNNNTESRSSQVLEDTEEMLDSSGNQIADSTIIESGSSEGSWTEIVEQISSGKAEDVIELSPISFNDKSEDIPSEQLEGAEEIITLFRENPRLQLQVIANNFRIQDKLTLKRAFAFKKYLLENGVENLRVDAVTGVDSTDTYLIRIISN